MGDTVNPKLEDEIGNIAESNKFVFFSDIHTETGMLEVVSNPNVIGALADAGHKTIASEIFDVGQNQIFDAYFNGEISDNAMRTYIENLPLNFESDFGVSDDPALQKYADIVEIAKENGIRFQGVGMYSGAVDRDLAASVLPELGQNDLNVLKAIDQNSEYYDLSPEEQEEFVSQQTVELGLDEIQARAVMTRFGFLEADATDIDYETRLAADPLQAELIREMGQEGGVTTLYGGLHMWRPQGDIDYTLGEEQTAVISVFEDSHKFWNEDLPAMRPDLNKWGAELENVGDYHLDLKTGNWYDSKTDQNYQVDLPVNEQEGPMNYTGEDPLISPILKEFPNFFTGVQNGQSQISFTPNEINNDEQSVHVENKPVTEYFGDKAEGKQVSEQPELDKTSQWKNDSTYPVSTP